MLCQKKINDRLKIYCDIIPLLEYGHPRKAEYKVVMVHSWIVEVLEDLRSYAVQNGLVATAAKAEEALKIAKAEIDHSGPFLGNVVEAPKHRSN